MGILRGNQKGVTLVGLVVGSGVSLTLAAGFAVFLIQQHQNMARLQTKVQLLDVQTTITKVLADANSCDCMFDMTKAANPYNNGVGSNKLQFATGTTEVDLKQFMILGRDITTGECDYSSSFTIAKPGESMMGISNKAVVDTVKLVDLNQTAALDTDENGTADAYQYKGNLQITFLNPEGEKSLDPLLSQVTFFTLPGATRVAKSCDPSGEIQELFENRLARFRAEREAADAAFAATLQGIRLQIAPEILRPQPVAVAGIDQVRNTATVQEARVTNGAQIQESLSTHSPGDGPYTERDDFQEILRDFKQRWGIPL